MKHGPFILITEAADLIEGDHPGVLPPDGVHRGVVASLKAVIFDDQLALERRHQLESLCRSEGIPCFTAQIPHDPRAQDHLALRAHLLRFLEEQNEWRNEPPSAETIERIELKTLVDIITTANSLLEPKDVMKTVMERIHELIPCEAWSVLVNDNNAENTLSFAVAHGPGSESLRNLKVPIGKGIAGWVAKHRKPAIVDNAKEDPRFFANIDESTRFVTRTILCAPLVSRGRTIGVIEMLNGRKQGGFTEQDMELVQVLVNPAAVAIENAYLFQKAQMLTIMDDLTRLYNARHLNHCLELESKRAEREQGCFSLIFLDLDGFKSINDNYGHLVGSRALVDIGQILTECCAPDDIVGRYGGDEFMVILPHADADAARERAHVIRNSIGAYRMREHAMTASIGVACYPRHSCDKEQLVRLADQAMYRVKGKGKNGVLLAHELD